MEAVLHRDAKKIALSLGEGGYEKGGGLDIGYGIFAGVVRGKEGPRFLGGQAGGGQGQQQVPV